MVSLNRVIIAGNLVRDPEMKVSGSNHRFTNLTVAINDSWRNQEGEYAKKVTYLNVITWGNLAENCAKYLSKGAPIMVEGRIEVDNYINKDGQKQYSTKIVANTITFLENKTNKNNNSNGKKSNKSSNNNVAEECLEEPSILF
mgnify:CR=1 FL=1